MEEIANYLESGQVRLGQLCFWYDANTKQCRHYGHRPELCRNFIVGGSKCVSYRSGNSREVVEGLTLLKLDTSKIRRTT